MRHERRPDRAEQRDHREFTSEGDSESNEADLIGQS